MMYDFFPSEEILLIPYEKKYSKDLIKIITDIYCEYNQIIEIDTLDNDLLNIETIYVSPCGFWVLLDTTNNKIIGSVGVKIKNEIAELKRVFLEKSYRGKGLGRGLCNFGFYYAKEKGCKKIDIWTDVTFTIAHKLYENLGAQKTTTSRHLGGINNVSEYYFFKML